MTRPATWCKGRSVHVNTLPPYAILHHHSRLRRYTNGASPQHTGWAIPMLTLFLTAALSPTQPPTDWKAAEAAHLANIKQVTFDYVRAGEGYFSPDGKQIIFQAEEKGTGNPFYQIFVQDLA